MASPYLACQLRDANQLMNKAVIAGINPVRILVKEGDLESSKKWCNR
jgi:hypothetical protein